MEREAIISINEKGCVSCYACVRSCPVRAIQVLKDRTVPTIDHNRCIACGNCLTSCAFGVISYKDSCEAVKSLLQSDTKVGAICDPAIAGEFDDITDYRRFVKMIRLLGFSYVSEVSFGVDLVARKFKELTENFKGRYYLTANCPAMVMLVENFYPELVDNIAPIISPAAAAAQVMRKQHGEELKVVYITPCVAAKRNPWRFDHENKIDEVLTFEELRKLFKEFNIKESTMEYSEFDKPYGYKGSLYPIPEGFLEADDMDLKLLTSNIITAYGKTDALASVKQFSENSHFIKRNFNLFFCKGCLAGPGMSKGGKKYIRHTFVTDYADKRLQIFDKTAWEQQMTAFLTDNKLSAKYQSHSKSLPIPNEKDVEYNLNLIRTITNGGETNCTACGYSSCTDLAISISQGIAIPELCYMYAQHGVRNYSRSLETTNEQLTQTNEELNELKKNLLLEKNELNQRNKAFSALIQNINAGIVIVDKDLKIVESNRSFIELLGDDAKEIDEIIPLLRGADLKTLIPSSLASQFNYILTGGENILSRDVEFDGKLINVTIFSLIADRLVGALFRNLRSAEERPEEIIHRVTEVIEENLRQVQQIGFILGEGAGKTEKMLNSIIKSYRTGNDTPVT